MVRVLDRAQLERLHGTLTLQALGFAPAMPSAVLNLARAPHGMLLVAGPTGSGKTTTLYAALTETQRPGDRTVSIEDPVEYLLPGAMQIPVNERKGLGFARGLHALLRHDPDRIMVGEIRDAEIALQAALTGHVVYSTVYANSAFDVIGRLTHMALDPYTVVSALNGVLAQRLLRVVCPSCAVPDDLTPESRATLGSRSDVQRRHGTSCPDCRGSGFRGRRAVAELMVLDDTLRGLIVARAAPAELKEAARRQGMRPLREAALDLVAHTSVPKGSCVVLSTTMSRPASSSDTAPGWPAPSACDTSTPPGCGSDLGAGDPVRGPLPGAIGLDQPGRGRRWHHAAAGERAARHADGPDAGSRPSGLGAGAVPGLLSHWVKAPSQRLQP